MTDGPFSESKEVIGGWAVLEADTKEQVPRVAREFMELHRKHWPELEGESEVRPMFEPGMGTQFAFACSSKGARERSVLRWRRSRPKE